MSLFRRLAIFIVLLAFFPLFCGALHCVVGLHGLYKLYKGEDVKFYDGTCDTSKHQRCYKANCSTASGQTFLDLGCYAKDKHCDFYNKDVNDYFSKQKPPSEWKCTCEFGDLFKDDPFTSVCKHAFTFDNTIYKVNGEFAKEIEKWEITKDKPDIKCHGEAMEAKVGCQTYRCMDEYNNDVFVINGCATDRGNCSHTELDEFCKLKSKKLRTKCDFCYDEDTVCNANNTELLIKTYIDCKLSMDYSWLYTPSAELKEWLTNRNMEKNLRTCAKRIYKCQAFTCTDKATGYPLFVFKDCAEPNGKCPTNVLKKFCPPSFKPTCYACDGFKCNQRMPTPKPFTPFQYFAWDNCAAAPASCRPGAAKFSRRFAIGQKCENVYNERVWNSMGEDKAKKIYDEYKNSDKANDPLFLADFIRAFIEDEKKEEGNEEEDE